MRLSEKEAKQLQQNRVRGARKPSGLRQDDAVNEVYKQAVEALRHLQGANRDLLHAGDVGCRMVFPQKVRCDLDNAIKAVLDAIQGIVFKDDKQVSYIESNKSGSSFK